MQPASQCRVREALTVVTGLPPHLRRERQFVPRSGRERVPNFIDRPNRAGKSRFSGYDEDSVGNGRADWADEERWESSFVRGSP